MVDKSPAEDKLLQREVRVWEPKEHRPTLTWSRSGYKPYSTYVELVLFDLDQLTKSQSQEQDRPVDTDCQGTRVDVRFLLLAMYISGRIKDQSRSKFTRGFMCAESCALQNILDTLGCVRRKGARCHSQWLITNPQAVFYYHTLTALRGNSMLVFITPT